MLLCTIFAAVTAVIFNINAIIEMLSIGTLFAYLLVAFAVLVVRHTSDEDIEVRECRGSTLSIHLSSPTVLNRHLITSRFQKELPINEAGIALKSWAESFRGLYPSNLSQRNLVISVLSVVTALAFGVGFSLNSKLDSAPRFGMGGTCGVLMLLCVAYLVPLDELKKDDKYKVGTSF